MLRKVKLIVTGCLTVDAIYNYRVNKKYNNFDYALEYQTKLLIWNNYVIDMLNKLSDISNKYFGKKLILNIKEQEKASNDITRIVNQHAKEMGIDNHVNVLITDQWNDLNSFAGAFGLNHPLNDINLYFNSQLPNKFLLFHELSHIKLNHSCLDINWTGVTPASYQYSQRIFNFIYPFTFLSRYMFGLTVVTYLSIKYLKLYHMKRMEQEADMLALTYCTDHDIRTGIEYFREIRNIHQKKYLSNPLQINDKGDIRYFFDDHPYMSTRIEYMKQALSDLLPLKVSLIYPDNSRKEFNLNDDDNKTVRELIESSSYNIKLLSVSEMNIDLRTNDFPVVCKLAVPSNAIPLFNIHPNFDRNQVNKEKLDLELMKNIFNTEQEGNSYSIVLDNYTGSDDEIKQQLKDDNWDYIRTVETNNNDLHLIVKKKK